MTPQPPPDAPQLPPDTEYFGLLRDFPDSSVRGHVWFPGRESWSDLRLNSCANENNWISEYHLALPVKPSPAVPVKAGEEEKITVDGLIEKLGQMAAKAEPPVTDSQRPDKIFMDQFSPDQRNLMDALQDIADLKAELAAAKQDSERLEWLLAKRFIIETDSHGFIDRHFDTRAEIDDAMREGGG